MQKKLLWLLPIVSLALLAYVAHVKSVNAVCYGCTITTYDRNCYEANDDGTGYPPDPSYRDSSCPYPPTTTYSTSSSCSCGTTNYCSAESAAATDSDCGIVPTNTPVPPTPTPTPTERPTPTPESPTATTAPTATSGPAAGPTSASACLAGQNRVNCNNTWFTCCTGSTGYCTLDANGAANGVSCSAPAATATSAPTAATATTAPAGGCVTATAHCNGDYTACCPGGVVWCTADGFGASCSAPGGGGGDYGGGEYGGGEYAVEPPSWSTATRRMSGENVVASSSICAFECFLNPADGSTTCNIFQVSGAPVCVNDNHYLGAAGGTLWSNNTYLRTRGFEYDFYPNFAVQDTGSSTGGYGNAGGSDALNCLGSGDYCYQWDASNGVWDQGRKDVVVYVADPTPTPYPTVVIQGNLKEYLGGSCPANVSSNSISLNMNPVSSSGITVNCGVTPPAGSGTQSTYRCTIAFNNQAASPTPAQNFTLSASASSYSPAAGWFTGAVNSCTTTSDNIIALDVAAPAPTTTHSRDIFFDSSSRWVKLKNASFAGIGSLSNNIPLNLSAYDSDDSAAQRYFIMTGTGDDPGAASVNGTFTLGTADVSDFNWKSENNGMTSVWNRSSFMDYVKSRKSYTSISSLSEISANGIYYYSGLLPLSWGAVPSQFNTYKVVLIVPGQVDIDVANFNPTQSFALIADTINFNANVQSATGLFVAASVTTGDTTNQGLKITGNLIAQSSFNNQRDWTTNTKPSVFIVFDPSLYLNLLDTLSVASYDWRQLQ